MAGLAGALAPGSATDAHMARISPSPGPSPRHARGPRPSVSASRPAARGPRRTPPEAVLVELLGIRREPAGEGLYAPEGPRPRLRAQQTGQEGGPHRVHRVGLSPGQF